LPFINRHAPDRANGEFLFSLIFFTVYPGLYQDSTSFVSIKISSLQHTFSNLPSLHMVGSTTKDHTLTLSSFKDRYPLIVSKREKQRNSSQAKIIRSFRFQAVQAHGRGRDAASKQAVGEFHFARARPVFPVSPLFIVSHLLSCNNITSTMPPEEIFVLLNLTFSSPQFPNYAQVLAPLSKPREKVVQSESPRTQPQPKFYS